MLSFDFDDAESGFLFREPEKAKRSLADLEERRFGPRVGVDRILRPSAERGKDIHAAIRDGGEGR